MSTRLYTCNFTPDEEAFIQDRIRLACEHERERCAKIAISFGDFPGDRLVKEIRVMCGNTIADKIRETALPPAEGKTP